MSTPVFTSKKLEKLIRKYIKPSDGIGKTGVLGKWNATVFYLNRRKNWLLFNPKTHYILMLFDVMAKDLPTIQERICQELFLQMVLEGMDVTHEQVKELVGEISFHSTDADRSALGHINQILFAIECHLNGEYFRGFDQINAMINSDLFSLDGAGKYTNLTSPREEMGKLVGQFLGPIREMPIHPISLN